VRAKVPRIQAGRRLLVQLCHGLELACLITCVLALEGADVCEEGQRLQAVLRSMLGSPEGRWAERFAGANRGPKLRVDPAAIKKKKVAGRGVDWSVDGLINRSSDRWIDRWIDWCLQTSSLRSSKLRGMEPWPGTLHYYLEVGSDDLGDDILNGKGGTPISLCRTLY